MVGAEISQEESMLGGWRMSATGGPHEVVTEHWWHH